MCDRRFEVLDIQQLFISALKVSGKYVFVTPIVINYKELHSVEDTVEYKKVRHEKVLTTINGCIIFDTIISSCRKSNGSTLIDFLQADLLFFLLNLGVFEVFKFIGIYFMIRS